MEHTPLPWKKVESPFNDDNWEFLNSRGFVILTTVYGSDVTQEECKDNAEFVDTAIHSYYQNQALMNEASIKIDEQRAKITEQNTMLTERDGLIKELVEALEALYKESPKRICNECGEVDSISYGAARILARIVLAKVKGE